MTYIYAARTHKNAPLAGPEVKFLHPHNVPFSQWKCPLEN
jgi:hypothetical protein